MKSLTRMLTSALLGAALLVAGLSTVPAAAAQDDENFYKDKTITVIIRSKPGGGYDFYGRLIANHIGKYIPGNPEVITVNRPGAGGLVAINYMYNRAPKDGTEILIASGGIALLERLGMSGVAYKTLEMPAIGSIASTDAVWVAGPDVPVESLEDLDNLDEPFRYAASGKGSNDYQRGRLLKEAGYPLDIITGYEGTSNSLLAVLRGEADGTSKGYSSLQDAIHDEGFKPFAKLSNNPDLADVEDVREVLTGDYRSVANVIAGTLVAARPFFTAPGTPPERVAILRKALRKALKDPQLRDQAKRSDRPLNYTSPEEMTELYHGTLDASDKVIELLQAE